MIGVLGKVSLIIYLRGNARKTFEAFGFSLEFYRLYYAVVYMVSSSKSTHFET